MTRLLSLCLGVGLLPFAVGCVEDLKAEEKAKPAATTRTDPPPGDTPKAEKKPAGELPDLPANDPLVADAVQAREQIARLEEELLERLDELRAVLASAKANPERLRESVEQFLELTKDVRRKTVQAGDALHAVEAKTADLSRSSRHLAASYRALADLYRRKARDYSEPKLREQLVGFAADYDAVAAAMPERCKALDGVRKKLPGLKRKVSEVNAFLGDTAAFLHSHPTVGVEQRERYAGEFASFAVTFSEWLRTLDELRAALRERAVSKTIQVSHRNEVAERQRVERTNREEAARLERARLEALAKAEQAQKDEQERQAKLAEEERTRLARERERQAQEREATARERARLARTEANRHPPVLPPPTVTLIRHQPVVYRPAVWTQRVVYPATGVCQCGVTPVYRSYP